MSDVNCILASGAKSYTRLENGAEVVCNLYSSTEIISIIICPQQCEIRASSSLAVFGLHMHKFLPKNLACYNVSSIEYVKIQVV